MSLSDIQQHARRASLDNFALYTQLQTFIPPLLWLCYYLTRSGARVVAKNVGKRRSAGQNDVSLESTETLLTQKTKQPLVRRGSRSFQKILWWFGGDIVFRGDAWGHRDVWIFGSIWFVWLVLLCFVDTGNGECPYTCRKRFTCLFPRYCPSSQALRYHRSLATSNTIYHGYEILQSVHLGIRVIP